MIYFSAVSLIGVILNFWLYFDDLLKRDGILNKVASEKKVDEIVVSDSELLAGLTTH